MGRKDANKPRGRMTAYAFFIQTCREEHKKKHPGETVQFSEFSKKCSEKWKEMSPKEKKRFEDMAGKDKVRYDKEMANYTPPAGADNKRKRKKKDPNAPKRPLSAFFLFCNEERPKVRAVNPGASVGEVAKELGRRWEACTNRGKFEALNEKAKEKYEKEMAAYKKGGAGASSPKKGKKKAEPEPEEEEEEEEEEEIDEEEDDEEEDDE